MTNKKYLITSALPYVNNDLHIGHLIGCYLPSDVYARFIRARFGAENVLFVCGADEHGTTSEIGAMKEGIPVEEYVDKYRARHEAAVRDFDLSFDLYGRTHTKLHEKLVQDLFSRLDAQGLIEERVSIQPYSIKDKMFLADRFVIGTCPKCGYDKAYGNECEKCVSVLEPADLINPRSAVTADSPVEMRETKHLYFRASAVQGRLSEWIDSRRGWPKTAMAIARKWLAEGLRDTPITRDLKWGIPVNKPGYENKVFYVWFDAPWGYVSISQAANKNWAEWWKNPDCHYAQFMGKDNVAFHAVFFPEQQLAMNDNWKTVDLLKAVNFLNFEGAKISKSTGNGIFLTDALTDAPSDAWRYALIASAPETDDTDFTVQRFADIVNKDLNGMLGNFVSRVAKLTRKNFGPAVPERNQEPGTRNQNGATEYESAINQKLFDLTAALEACEFRKAVEALRSMWAVANEYMTAAAPWTLVKNGDMAAAGAVLNECFQMIDFFARVSAPFIPDTAEKMLRIFGNRNEGQGTDWPERYERRIADGAPFVVPENLFERIDDVKIAEMTEKYSKRPANAPAIIVAKIKSVAAHPGKEGLSVLTVDAGDEELQIVCGAPNVRAGFVGVLARVGAILPGARKPLTKRAVAGVESHGMLCSAAELGVGADDENILELPADSKIGEEFKK
jgi:methionyl-tRNA synthetase